MGELAKAMWFEHNRIMYGLKTDDELERSWTQASEESKAPFRAFARAALDWLGFPPDAEPEQGAVGKAIETLEDCVCDSEGCSPCASVKVALMVLTGE